MKIVVFVLIITIVGSLCPDKYSQPIENGLKVDLNHLPIKNQLWEFLRGNFSLPDPILSSYFAYETRIIAENVECFKTGDSTISYSLNGFITISGGVGLKEQLMSLTLLFDEITESVLYDTKRIYIEAKYVSFELIRDYNFECVRLDTGVNMHESMEFLRDFLGSECNRMLVVQSNFKINVYKAFQEIIFQWIN